MASTLPTLGVPFVPATMEQIRDMLLADIRLEMLKTNGVEAAVSEGSDNWAWATAHAGLAMLQFSNIELSRDAITPLNATGHDLENWRIALGLPEVKPSPSSGKIVLTVTGTATVLDGEPLVMPNGLRAQVVGNWIGVSNLAEIDAIAIDVGSRTNLQGGTEIRFVTAPTNVDTKATVSKLAPFTGGTDSETDARKRIRVLNAIANKLAAGSWSQIRALVLDNFGGIQDCYVYPALGGPASVKVVPVVDYDVDNGLFTRAVNDATLASIRNTLYANLPDGQEIVIEAVADQMLDVALKVTIPNSLLNGGDGSGWLDTRPWPQLQGGETRVTVWTVNSSTSIVVTSLDVSPIAGTTHIAWWSTDDRKFRSYLVTAVSGSASAWSLTLDRPLVSDDGTEVLAGDFICPAAVHSADYGKSWVNVLRKIGIGENVSTGDPRLPRAQRQPTTAEESPAGVTFTTLKAFQQGHDEITEIVTSYANLTTPSVPGSVDNPPNVLVPRQFAMYPL